MKKLGAVDALLSARVALRFAKNWPNSDAMNKYLREHPNADARQHQVVRPQDKSDEDKFMDDLKSRARHMKRQDKKKEKAKEAPKEPAKPAE